MRYEYSLSPLLLHRLPPRLTVAHKQPHDLLARQREGLAEVDRAVWQYGIDGGVDGRLVRRVEVLVAHARVDADGEDV